MNVEQIGDVLVIELPGRLDVAGLAAIEGPFAEVAAAHKGKVLVDMHGVTFVASLALRMLLMALKALQSHGGDLRLSGLQPQVADIFHKSRFDTLFKIYPDREAALRSYTSA